MRGGVFGSQKSGRVHAFSEKRDGREGGEDRGGGYWNGVEEGGIFGDG